MGPLANSHGEEKHKMKAIMVEVEIQPRRFNRSECLLVAIRNVSSAISSQALNIKSRRTQLIQMRMQHELLGTLSSIVNISNLLMEFYSKKTFLTLNQQINFTKIVWSSACQLEMSITSTLSQFQLENESNRVNCEKRDAKGVKKILYDVTKPYQLQIKE